ncbi:pfkB family kinase [Xylariaceae sp. FL0016]|nr:pfkB family kinase [Xylariaceae sp. FL0016]
MAASKVDSRSIHFVSLGMVVLDELHLPNGEVLHDTVGGSGAYSTLGARLVTPPNDPPGVGCFIQAGRDFPDDIAARLRSWGIEVVLSIESEKLSTRGLLEYHDEAFGHKSFRYVTAPLQPTPSALPARFLASTAFHILSSPENLAAQTDSLLDLRAGLPTRPLIVWEPLPGKCTPEQFDSHVAACGSVDVFSPNHLEALALCGQNTARFDKSTIEACAARILAQLQSSATKLIVIRAGEHGCFVSGNETKFWLPPFFTSGAKIIDATGGGNTFLGAFTMAYGLYRDIRRASIEATVAASFAIEQIGLPTRTTTPDSAELWNGASFPERLRQYQERI